MGKLFIPQPLFPQRGFRALSLWQPHAQAIALGVKLYETRHWETKYRGPLVVHAAQKKFRHQDYPLDYYNEAGKRLKAAGCPLHALSYGEAVALVDLVDCVPTESLGAIGDTRFWGDFTPGRFAFRLENVRRIYPPLKVKGKQGFFRVTIPEDNDALTGVKRG